MQIGYNRSIFFWWHGGCNEVHYIKYRNWNENRQNTEWYGWLHHDSSGIQWMLICWVDSTFEPIHSMSSCPYVRQRHDVSALLNVTFPRIAIQETRCDNSFQQTSWASGCHSCFVSGCPEFKYRSGDWLSWLKTFVVFFSPFEKITRWCFGWGHERLLPYPFQFSIYLSSCHSTLCGLSYWLRR